MGEDVETLESADRRTKSGDRNKKNRSCVVVQADLVNKEITDDRRCSHTFRHRDWPFVVDVASTKGNGQDWERYINLILVRVTDVCRVEG
jgi:mRNA-degrading endonuclease toxin of MazEF toxin-antitoxin module